jgi:RNA polymerase sigma-70 factor (ECF subfamily)
MTAASLTLPIAPWSDVAGESALPMSVEPAAGRFARLPRMAAVRRSREAALVRSAQRGSDEALEELFRRHWRATHRAAFLVVHDAAAAEDIAQESFLAAIRALDRFDRGRPFGPWLHRIAVNRAIDWSRSRKLRGEVAAFDETIPDEGAGRQLSDELLAALGELGPEQRAVVVLRYLLGYAPGEIGEMLEMPRGTVNSRMRRALDRLRPLLQGGEE